MRHNEKSPNSVVVARYVRNLYLITKSDHATLLYPGTYFAFVSALSGPILIRGGSAPPLTSMLLINLSKALFWIYFNLLITGLSNQRLPNAVLEDKVNNPWRNIPVVRMTSEQYRRLLLVLIPLALGMAWYLDVVSETAMLIILNYMYNDMEGADEHFVIRNLFNVFGYFQFEIGALRIAYGPHATLNRTAYIWLVMIGAVMFRYDFNSRSQGSKGRSTPWPQKLTACTWRLVHSVDRCSVCASLVDDLPVFLPDCVVDLCRHRCCRNLGCCYRHTARRCCER